MAHREAIKQAAAMHKGKTISLVGSVARGDDNPYSDYDFLVDFEDGACLLDRARLIAALKDILGEEVDVVRLGKRVTPGKAAMLEDALTL